MLIREPASITEIFKIQVDCQKTFSDKEQTRQLLSSQCDRRTVKKVVQNRPREFQIENRRQPGMKTPEAMLPDGQAKKATPAPIFWGKGPAVEQDHCQHDRHSGEFGHEGSRSHPGAMIVPHVWSLAHSA